MIRVVILLIIVSFASAVDETTIIDNEDLDGILAELEEAEIRELPTDRQQSRLRVNPEVEKEAVFYRTVIKTPAWQVGLRIDHSSSTDRTDLTKLFFQVNRERKKILLGNLKIERGQGLLFGNAYGRLISTSSPHSFIRTLERSGYDLTSFSNTGIMGSLFELKTITRTHSILLGSCPMGIKRDADGKIVEIANGAARTINRNIAGYLLAGTFNEMKYGLSLVEEFFSEPVIGRHGQSTIALYASKSVSSLKIDSEIALSGHSHASILNIAHRGEFFGWFVHQRYLSADYNPLIGSPLAEFGDGQNESGWVAGTTFKVDKIRLNTWVGFSNQIIGESGHTRNKARDLLIYFKNAEFYRGTLELRYRQRQKFYVQHLTHDGIEQAYWSPVVRKYYNMSYQPNGIRNFKLKINLIQYRPNIEMAETGTLISILFPEVSQSKIAIHYGLHFFSTDGWNSRLYDYEYSLPGEFRLVPFYETGAEAYGVCSIMISQGVKAGTRISYEWKTSQESRRDLDIALQLDIQI